MELTPLTAISPIDGRYHSKTNALQMYFSEFGLIKYRVFVEVAYFISLVELPLPALASFPENGTATMQSWCTQFSVIDAKWIKEKEISTNHDVKAVEYFLKHKFEEAGWNDFVEFIHFGLTSQDINNTAIPLSLKEGIEALIFPQYELLIAKLRTMAVQWKDVPMLARTHGQAASPTRLGKEIQVFQERLEGQLNVALSIPYTAKFGGATGNFNAHHVAYPNVDWVEFGNHFLNSLGLKRNQTTTQIDHYDTLAALFDALKRMNTILIDLNRDMWAYISMNYFKQQVNKGEIGSSAMPHKVNPIDFENSEGNLGLANALFEYMSGKLPISRLQRDLTDSTVLRSIGVPLGHSLISVLSTLKGLDKLILNEAQLALDLDDNWAVIAEAIQTILRREKFDKPYEALKDLTRNNEKITKESVHQFIDSLSISAALKNELKFITPSNYLGIQLVKV
jgi:adenylosuccinate lyase